MGGNALTEVLAAINRFPRKLQSNFVRAHPYEIARLASLGLITTRDGDAFGHHWRCTSAGLSILEQMLTEL